MPRLTPTQLTADYKPPRVDWDELGPPDFRELHGFKQYTLKVYAAFKAGAKTVGDIKRALGEGWQQRWFFDAIESLEGAGLVQEVGVAPLRWIATRAAQGKETGLQEQP